MVVWLQPNVAALSWLNERFGLEVRCLRGTGANRSELEQEQVWEGRKEGRMEEHIRHCVLFFFLFVVILVVLIFDVYFALLCVVCLPFIVLLVVVLENQLLQGRHKVQEEVRLGGGGEKEQRERGCVCKLLSLLSFLLSCLFSFFPALY